MPKDEFDPEDPLEAVAVELPCTDDTLVPMAECFIEEFMRMGYSAEQIAGLFQNPLYGGLLLVTRARGMTFVRQLIAETFAKWGRGTPLLTGRGNPTGGLTAGGCAGSETHAERGGPITTFQVETGAARLAAPTGGRPVGPLCHSGPITTVQADAGTSRRAASTGEE